MAKSRQENVTSGRTKSCKILEQAVAASSIVAGSRTYDVRRCKKPEGKKDENHKSDKKKKAKEVCQSVRGGLDKKG